MTIKAEEADDRWATQFASRIGDPHYEAVRLQLEVALAERADEEGWDADMTATLRAAALGVGPDSWLDVLFQEAIKEVSLDDETMSLYFVQIPAAGLNGFALRAPATGTPVIVLNHGLVAYVGHAMHMMLGLTGMTGTPYCAHHPPEVFLRDLVALADGVAAHVPAFMLALKSPECFSDHGGIANELHHALCTIAELFVIFHELGHVVLRHHDAGDVRAVTIDTAGGLAIDVDVLNQAQRQELEADRFAFEALVAMNADTGLEVRDIAFAAGCLFAFMHVGELRAAVHEFDSHPSAFQRWEHLRSIAGRQDKNSWTNSIDYFYKWWSEGDSAIVELLGRPDSD